jgi:hypothetical protein
MKLEQQVCSLDLAKRLKELGVHQLSLFWWQFWLERPEDIALRYKDDRFGHRDVQDVSAFTVAELGEMLPKNIERDIGTTWLLQMSGKNGTCIWDVGYMIWNKRHKFDWADVAVTQRADTEADARAKMLIYLIENAIVTA